MHDTTKSRKVLLIGWDAADWKIINPMIDEGKMPNLAKLVEQGTMGNLATLQPVLSPMLWTSIATGKRPYKHGVLGFSEPDPVTSTIRPVTNLSRKTKAVWNILNQEGRSTITVGWWPSNPAEPLSKGVMVSNDYQRAAGNDPAKWPMKPGTVHPDRLRDHLKELRFHPAELTENDLRPFLPGIEGMGKEDLEKVSKDPRIQSLMKIIADCTCIHAAATALMQNEPWDLMSVYYDAIDHFGHGFMKYHPPRRKHIDEWDFKVFNYCIEAGYRYHDMLLGTLLSLAGEDTTVILMSDHGFHPDDLRPSSIPREPAGPAAEHRQFGIFVAKGPDIRRDDRVYGANLLDICPTLLHLFGLPVGEDMDGKVLLDIYADEPAELRRIPSWDEVDGDHGMHPPDRQISAEDSKAALDQLVALGYIDEPDEDKATALDNTVRELDYNLAQSYIDGGIYTEAITILERLYEKWPMEHRFGYKLTVCHQALGSPGEMRRYAATVIERRIKEAEEAVAELKELGLDDEQTRKAEQEKVEAMEDKEKAKFQRERRTLLAKARPNLFSMRYLEASADFAGKDYEEALEKLAQLDSDYGGRRAALTLRGDTLAKLKRWPEARAAYEEALEIDRESPGPLLGLARVCIASRDFEGAINHARNSLGLLFFQPRAHYLCGLAHYRLGQVDEADQALQLCLRQAPLFAAAHRLLGEIARWHRGDAAAYVFHREQMKGARKRLAELKQDRLAKAKTPADDTPEDQRPMPGLEPRPEALAGVDPGEIITIVSGLPRSGTSLMMQILEAAGIPAFTDGKRAADDSNRKGYFEHDKVTGLLSSKDQEWLGDARGRAVKVVAPLLSSFPPRLKADDSRLKLRVLYMERNMDEVLKSQTAMLDRLGKPQPKGDVSRAYRQQVRAARIWINRHGIPAMAVDYGQLVHDPASQLPQIAAFLGCEDRLDDMRAVIDPSMHRARVDPSEPAA